jgi:hypothetical protein
MASFRQKVGSFIAGKKGLINQTSISTIGVSNLEAVWGQFAKGNLTTLFHSIGEIFIPIHLIAAGVASGVYTIRKVSDKSLVENNAYMNKLFATPNPLQNWAQLIYQNQCYELVTGESFMYANAPDVLAFNYRNISTLVNMPSEDVQIQQQPILKLLSATVIEDLIKSYILPNASQGMTEIAPQKVMFNKCTSLKGVDMNIQGRSPALSAEKAISNLVAVYEARNVIYVNRGALVIISSAKSDADGNKAFTAPEKKEVSDEFNKYGLTKGKKPFLVTNQAISATSISATIKDMEPFRETIADAEVIFGVYDVPTELMPRSEGNTYENQKQAEKRLYTKVIIPRAKSLAQSLTTFLKLNEAGLYIDVDFSHVPALQQDLKEKADVDWRNNETYRVKFSHGVCTLNDWRVAFKQLPVTGNKIYDKLVFEMDNTELKLVETILKMSRGGTKQPTDANSNSNDAAATQ